MRRMLGLLLFGAACDEPSRVAGPNCADIAVPALTVIAYDWRTRQTITSKALVVARDGAYADTASGATVATPPLYTLAYNRPGTYSVTVQLSGYEPWRVDGVVAPRGICNVMTIPLAASLMQVSPTRTN